MPFNDLRVADYSKRERNEDGATIDWPFSSQDTRVKLNRIYHKEKLMNRNILCASIMWVRR